MTTKVVEGVVMSVSEKQVNTKNGVKPVYDIKLHDGTSEGWYKFGFTNPNVSKNQRVKFVAQEQAWTGRNGTSGVSWVHDKSSPIEIAPANEPATSPQVKTAVRSVNDTQRSICLQSAYERAIMTVGIALENDFLVLPKAKAAKFDALKAIVKDTAFEYADLFISPPESFSEEDEAAEDLSEEDVFDDEYAAV